MKIMNYLYKLSVNFEKFLCTITITTYILLILYLYLNSSKLLIPIIIGFLFILKNTINVFNKNKKEKK